MNNSISCRACNKDITHTEHRSDFRLLLANEDVPHDPAIDITPKTVFPAIAEDMRFCDLACLWGWLNLKKDALAVTWKSRQTAKPGTWRSETEREKVVNIRPMKCPRCGNKDRDKFKSDSFTPDVPNAKSYQRMSCECCGYASYNARQWLSE